MLFLKQYLKGLSVAVLVLVLLGVGLISLWAISILGFDTVDHVKLTVALMKEPKNGKLYFKRATLRLNHAELNGALSDLNQSVLFFSETEASNIDMARTYRIRGDTYEALATDRHTKISDEVKRKYYYSALADYEKAFQLYSGEGIPAGVSSADSSIKRVQREISILNLILNDTVSHDENK